MNWTFNHLKCIWSLNRAKPHNHVVRLLKGSGSRPTLLVQWRPTSALKHQSSLSSIPSSSRSSQLSVTFENERPATVSRCSSRASKAFSIRSDLFMNGTGYSKDDLRILSRQFKIQVRWCLGLMAWCNLVDFFVRNVLKFTGFLVHCTECTYTYGMRVNSEAELVGNHFFVISRINFS